MTPQDPKLIERLSKDILFSLDSAYQMGVKDSLERIPEELSCICPPKLEGHCNRCGWNQCREEIIKELQQLLNKPNL